MKILKLSDQVFQNAFYRMTEIHRNAGYILKVIELLY